VRARYVEMALLPSRHQSTGVAAMLRVLQRGVKGRSVDPQPLSCSSWCSAAGLRPLGRPVARRRQRQRRRPSTLPPTLALALRRRQTFFTLSSLVGVTVTR
jgi:hypothetical protein